MAKKKRVVNEESNLEVNANNNNEFKSLLGNVLDDIQKDKLKDIWQKNGMECIHTRFTGLNRVVGVGGINISGIWLIHGPTHSGKSALVKLISRTFLEEGDMVFYYNYEKADKDDKWTHTLLGGKYKDQYIERKPMDFEEGANEMTTLMKTFYENRKKLKEQYKKLKKSDEDKKEEIEKLMKKKICFVIDTVAKMVPRDEREGEIGKKNFGLLAALCTQFMRVATSYIGEEDSNMTLILVQHERQNQKAKGPYDPTWVLGPGGESINQFDPDVKLRVTHSLIKEEGTELGKECTIRVYKCKIGISGQECKFFIGNGKGKIPYGFDFEREALIEAINRDSKIVKKDGSKYIYEGELLAVGLDNAVEYLRENPDIYTEIVNELNDEYTSVYIEE